MCIDLAAFVSGAEAEKSVFRAQSITPVSVHGALIMALVVGLPVSLLPKTAGIAVPTSEGVPRDQVPLNLLEKFAGI